MKIIEPGFVFEDEIDPAAIMAKIERAGRTCYKSEDNALNAYSISKHHTHS